MACRAIKAAGYLIYGNETEKFAKLQSYAHELLQTMPGSTVILKFLCLDKYFLKGSFKGQILVAVGLDANNEIYPLAWAVVEVENTQPWTSFIKLLHEDMDMDVDAEQWIVMTDQQKGLENAIAAEIPLAEHRLCVKHLHANWSKKFPGKTYKHIMWEAARAPNVPYFEATMNEIKKVSVEAFEALDRIDRTKWTKCAFRPGSNCDELVNNWAEAFNKVLVRARGQPILSMLNKIHQKVMKRLYKQAKATEKWRGDISSHTVGLIKFRERKIVEYITVYNGHSRYGVLTAHHAWVVDVQAKHCSCGLWQLSGVPYVHGVCVFMAQNKDSKLFCNEIFSKATQRRIYSHLLEPIRGPTLAKTTSPSYCATTCYPCLTRKAQKVQNN